MKWWDIILHLCNIAIFSFYQLVLFNRNGKSLTFGSGIPCFKFVKWARDPSCDVCFCCGRRWRLVIRIHTPPWSSYDGRQEGWLRGFVGVGSGGWPHVTFALSQSGRPPTREMARGVARAFEVPTGHLASTFPPSSLVRISISTLGRGGNLYLPVISPTSPHITRHAPPLPLTGVVSHHLFHQPSGQAVLGDPCRMLGLLSSPLLCYSQRLLTFVA